MDLHWQVVYITMNDATWENLMDTVRRGFAGRETARMIDKERNSLKEEIVLLAEDLERAEGIAGPWTLA